MLDDSVAVQERLDAARGLSAIAVLLDHAYTILMARLTGNHSTAGLLADIAGRHAVAIFFLLSGHLITRSIVLNIKRNGVFSVRDYALARVTRIYPPLLGSIAICLAVAALIFAFDLPGAHRPFGLPGDIFSVRDHYSVSILDVFSSIGLLGGMLQANGPLWSLYVECQLYLAVAAIVILLLGSDRLSKALSLIVLLAAAFLLSVQPLMVVLWALGSATTLLYQYRKVWLGLAVAGACFVVVREVRHATVNDCLAELVSSPTLLSCALVYCGLLFFAPRRIPIPAIAIESAAYSYSLYIIHFPLLLLLLALTQGWVGSSIWGAGLSCLAGIILILPVARAFAHVLENQALFKRWLVHPTPANAWSEHSGQPVPSGTAPSVDIGDRR